MNNICLFIALISSLTATASPLSAQPKLGSSSTDADDKTLIQEGENAATHDLRDPDSAKFRDIRVRGDNVCGEINAKNGFGAYIGYRPFYAVHRKEGSWLTAVSEDDLSQDNANWCVSNVTSARRDSKVLHDYEEHQCVGFDVSFHLLYSVLCPSNGQIALSHPRAAELPNSRQAYKAVHKVSLSEFLNIKSGMSYKEVVSIFGIDGKESSNTSEGGINIIEYDWVNVDGSTIIIFFQDDRLISKVQAGL